MVDSLVTDAALFPERVGDRLRAARLKAGLDLADIATKTRVPLRHLEGIEAGDYTQLPSATYCVGFVKSYARAVGADEDLLAQDVRAELELKTIEKRAFVEYDITDPARIPGKTLAWTAAAIAVLFSIGVMIWFSQRAADPSPATPITVDAGSAPRPARIVAEPAAAVPGSGQVTLTATSPVWMRVYEADGKRIFEKEMTAGESYAVPGDAVRPQILTGRPEALRVAIGGKEVAPLGPPEKTVKDVDVSSTALASRIAISGLATAQP